METRLVKLSYSFTYIPILRQTSGSRGLWGKYRFVADAEADSLKGPFDAWVVYNDLPDRLARQTICAPERTILVLGEPPSRSNEHPDYASQFGAYITCHPDTKTPNCLRSQQALPWWIGLRRSGRFGFEAVMGYDELAAMRSIPKTRELSIVCSSLAITSEHRRRLRFVRELIKHFRDRLEIFGEGFNPVGDKWEAIAPFKYTMVLENSRLADYWTEKLADAFLGGAMPIYWGCPNIDRYFPVESMVTIDIARPAEAIAIIERTLDQDPFETARTAIWEARRRVLDEYNLFPMLAKLLDELTPGAPRPVVLRPTSAFGATPRMRIQRGMSLARECVARSWLKIAG